MKETKCCQWCGKEFDVKDEPEDCFECEECKREFKKIENDHDSMSPGGR
jgi:hypothetical protein